MRVSAMVEGSYIGCETPYPPSGSFPPSRGLTKGRGAIPPGKPGLKIFSLFRCSVFVYTGLAGGEQQVQEHEQVRGRDHT